MDKIKLMSSDGRIFIWSIKAVQFSKYMTNLLEDSDDVTLIPIPCVDSRTLEIMQKYCEYHRDDNEADLPSKIEERDRWDMNFLASISKPQLDDVIMASLELDMEKLLDASCKTVANNIKGKSIEEMRAYLNIKCDLTPEEIAQIEWENQFIQEA